MKELFYLLVLAEEEKLSSLHFSTRLNILKPCLGNFFFLLSFSCCLTCRGKVTEMEFGLDISAESSRSRKNTSTYVHYHMYCSNEVSQTLNHLLYISSIDVGEGMLRG